VVASAPEARAFSSKGPQSYSVVTKDGRFVFVMLCPAAKAQDDFGKGAALRREYPSSGLYRNDGSRDPLWTVGWYAPRVHPASDGVHLVAVQRRHYIGYGAYDADRAVAFYASGALLRAYSDSELLDVSASLFFLNESTEKGRPEWLAAESFDDAN